MNIFEEADRLLEGPRHASYGDPIVMASKISQIWSGILGHQIFPHHVPLMLAGMKLARESHSHNEDNLVDAAAYLRILDDIWNYK